MSSKAKILIVFFIVLTAGFVFALSQINGGVLLAKRFKTVSSVEPFRFTNQHNGITTEKDIEGKVAVVEFFFTTCQTICPKMNTTMKGIYELYKNEPDFYILSHTSDPKNDSATQLKKYADSIGAGKNWIFLTGNKKDLYIAARKSYALDDSKATVTDPETDFIHTQLFALVNRKGELKKKVYDSFNKEEMEELKQDIRKALDGEL
jgi:protein SCO1/2